MSNFVGMTENNNAVIFGSEDFAKEFTKVTGFEYASFDTIPEGTGLLKTDLKKLWWEAPAAPVDTRTEDQKAIELLQAQLKAATDRNDFMEDCIADMATKVYNT